jgi:integrase
MSLAQAPRMARISGHVYRKDSRRGPARWYMKWRDVHGQHQRRIGTDWTGEEGEPPAGFLRKRDAVALLEETLVAARREARVIYEGRLVLSSPFGGVPWREVALAWLDWHRAEGDWKPSTLRNYESILRDDGPLMTAFGARPVRAIERREVRAWWVSMRESRSPRSANAQLTVFRIVVNWADGMDEYAPVPDPSKGIRKAPEPAAGKAPFFDIEEVLAIGRAAREIHLELAANPELQHRAFASCFDEEIFTLAAFAGLRRAELVSLRWENVDFDGMSLHVSESVSAGERSTPKGKRVRTVPMAPQVAQVLARLAPDDQRSSTELVFPGTGRDGKLDLDALSERFCKARDRAGITRRKPRGEKMVLLTFHDLRHTFASVLARDPRIAPLEIQLAAGHASFVTTERYMHLRPRRDDAERFGNAFAAAMAPERPRERAA